MDPTSLVGGTAAVSFICSWLLDEIKPLLPARLVRGSAAWDWTLRTLLTLLCLLILLLGALAAGTPLSLASLLTLAGRAILAAGAAHTSYVRTHPSPAPGA